MCALCQPPLSVSDVKANLDLSRFQCYGLRYKRIKDADGDDIDEEPSISSLHDADDGKHASSSLRSNVHHARPMSASSRLSGVSNASFIHSVAALHFPPGFVLQLPFAMVELSHHLGIEFLKVQFGKYSVRLVVSHEVQLLIEVETHGLRLDFLAFYVVGSQEAKQWLPRLVRVFELAVRLQLWRSGCVLNYAHAASRGRRDGICCHLHHEVSVDLPECSALPLCGTCLLRSGAKHGLVPMRAPVGGPVERAGAPLSLSTATVITCREGHATDAELVCSKLSAAAASPTVDITAIMLPRRISDLQNKLDNPHAVKKILTELQAEVHVVRKQLVFERKWRHRTQQSVDDLTSELAAARADLSSRMQTVEVRVDSFDHRLETLETDVVSILVSNPKGVSN